MSAQITFFRKSLCDFENESVIVTATEGQSSAANILSRSNRTAWGTLGSVDANNTQLTVDMQDVNTIDTLLLLKHNFKNFLIEYWDDINSVWLTLLNLTNVAVSSSYFRFSTINTSKFRLTIYNTQIANSDKLLSQFIATTFLGQLNGWPVIGKPVIGRNLIQQDMLSGKSHILQNVGFYKATLTVSQWRNAADLAIVETLFNSSEGFLYWPCGGDQSQFFTPLQGYRLEDIFLVRCENEYSPEYAYGLYKAGLKMQIQIKEVVT